MVRLQESRGSFTVALNREHVKRLGWAKGTELCVSFSPAGGLELLPIISKKN